jgi:hypothetical protein
MKFCLSSALAIALICSACGPINTMKDGFAHSQAVADSLEKALGVKAFVGFNSTNGSLDSVTVMFQGVPANVPLAEIVEKSRQTVVSEFKRAPSEVIVSFVLKS